MKRTHKLKAIGDARDIVGFARSRTEAAAQLGVNRSTLHRWIKAGKVPEPGSARPPRPAGEKTEKPTGVVPAQSPDDWAKAMQKDRELTATERQLLDLARAALTMAYGSDDEKTRLSAMARFQGLEKRLNLDAMMVDKPVMSAPARGGRPARRPSASMDPRKILSAVK